MITINWKTYKQANGDMYDIEDRINNWIIGWFLEEVENKEPNVILQEGILPMTTKFMTTSCRDTSIIEKLNEELEKMKEELAKDTAFWLHFPKIAIVDYVLSLLTSLETPSSPEIPDNWQPQFTPWQEIELLPAYEPSEPDWRDMQISLLTRTVNQLISK